MVEFIGVSGDPHRGVVSTGAGLYEFWTDSGVPVRLHEATFRGFEYRLHPEPSLTVTFEYDNPEWTPTEALRTPVIEIRFDGVSRLRWEEETSAFAEPREFHGEVALFDYDGREWFDLQVSTLRLEFTARRAEVTLRASS